MTRFTNFGSRGAPWADLHMKPPSTMGHESVIQRRAVLVVVVVVVAAACPLPWSWPTTWSTTCPSACPDEKSNSKSLKEVEKCIFSNKLTFLSASCCWFELQAKFASCGFQHCGRVGNETKIANWKN